MIDSDKSFYVQRTYTLPKISKLNEEIVQQLDSILEYASPEEYRNSLIEIYHSYLRHEHDSLPQCFDSIANQMSLLTDFLLATGKEMNATHKKQLVENASKTDHLKTDSYVKDLILLLAGEELKSCKFFSALRGIGLDDAFYQTNLCGFILQKMDFEEDTNPVLDTYFQLLSEYSKEMEATNESVQEYSLKFYEALMKYRNEIKYVHANG